LKLHGHGVREVRGLAPTKLKPSQGLKLTNACHGCAIGRSNEAETLSGIETLLCI